MKPPTPYPSKSVSTDSPFTDSQPEPAQGGQDFGSFVDDIQTLDKIKNPHFPNQNTGAHIPFWLSPAAAADVMKRHGQSGHAFPHPNMPMFNKR